MPRKALRVVVDVKFRAVSCPGVYLPSREDVYLSMCFLGQYRRSECLPAVFPLLFYEKMTFEKIFRHAVDPGDIALMLEYETVKVELVQLIPPGGDALACFVEDARSFLFPEPKLVPCFSGGEREVLMVRAPYFPGIAPRLEFSTKTTISECSADTETNVHPNVPMMIRRPASTTRRRARRPRRPRTASPQRAAAARSRTAERRRHGGRTAAARGGRHSSSQPRSCSLSPLSYQGNAEERLARLNLGGSSPRSPSPFSWDRSTASDPGPPPRRMLESWPAGRRSPSPPSRALSAAGRYSSPANGLVNGTSSSSDTLDDYPQVRSPSAMRRSHRDRHNGSLRGPQDQWSQVHERVRGLLTTPKAMHRLNYGVSGSEVNEVLARRSISPGPP